MKPRADDLTPAELAIAATDMDLEREPLLSDNGFMYREMLRLQAEQDANFIKWREHIRAPTSLAQFMAARVEAEAGGAIVKPTRKLKALVAKLAEVSWDGGTLDGGELQELLVEAGVLVEVMADEPCGPNCRCRACDAMPPWNCFRLTAAFK